jgi:hypothetical protein
VITPARGIPDGSTFTVNVRHAGVPQPIVGSPIVFGSPYGFIHTDDGAFMGDEPNAPSTWIPLNDHPSDKATWTFRVTVPAGLAVIANGRLLKHTLGWKVDGDLGRAASDVQLPRHRGHRPVGLQEGTTPGGIPETVGLDPMLLQSNPAAMDFFYDTTAEATDLRTDTFGPYPFRLDRRHRRQRHVQRADDRRSATSRSS